MHRLIAQAVAALVALVLATSMAAAQDGDVPLVRLNARGSPLISGSGGHVKATVSLAAPAALRLRVTDFDGRLVRELYSGQRRAGTLTRRWAGRDVDGKRVPSGPYRLRATARGEDGAVEVADTWVTVADRALYPWNPGLITVAVDPGHGGELAGAEAADGTREADLNLDIGLRLARMLEGAGVDVVITRTTDALVNTPPVERTGDGLIDDDDELAARPDLANTARADLFLSIHNNTAVNRWVGGPSTSYSDERPFALRSERLAELVQEEMVTALSDTVGGEWEPYDHGTITHPYYVLRGYDPPRLRRPTQMPGVLSEGLFLSNERELRYLKRPAVRGAMAVGYYDAIARYLAHRPVHVGYELVDAPAAPPAAGETATYVVEVRNQGTQTLRGWRLRASAVEARDAHYSRAREGKPAGGARIPDLRPGRSAVVEVVVTAPDPGGEWILLFDARDRDGRRAAGLGSPMLQARLATVDPPDLSAASRRSSGK